jgi:hypothetical protein
MRLFHQNWKMISYLIIISSKSQLNVVVDVDKAKEYPSKYICYCLICSRADHHGLFSFQDHEEDDQMTTEDSCS